MAAEERNDALAKGYKEPVARYEWAADWLCNSHNDLELVADVACGFGYGTSILGTILENIEVIGFDIGLEAIEYARRQYPGWPYVVANVEANTFEGFDAVVCLEALSHFDQPVAWLRELSVKHLIISAPMIPSKKIYPYRRHDIPIEEFQRMVSDRWKIIDKLNQRDRYLTLYGVRG
jgi:SAM-dependent methyltransferase